MPVPRVLGRVGCGRALVLGGAVLRMRHVLAQVAAGVVHAVAVALQGGGVNDKSCDQVL